MVSKNLEAQAEAVPPLVCAHCHLPVPSAMTEPEASEQFCCNGCRAVYQMIHAQGLQAYYMLRGDEQAPPAQEVVRHYEELDGLNFLARNCSARPDGLMTTELYLEGVHCSACLWLVEKSLGNLPGVAEARLNFTQARLHVTWQPTALKLSEIAEKLAGLGYPPHPARLDTSDLSKREERRLLIRIGVAGAVMGNVMLMAFALYGGWLSGMSEEFRTLFRWGSLVASLPAVIYSGWPFYRSAYTGLKNRLLHMDLPISVGILTGFFSGAANTIRGQGEVYFDSVCALIFLLLVGRLLQLKQQRRASDSSELLYALTPSTARRLGDDGEAQSVTLDALQVGDLVEVQAHEMIATDGVVVQGHSAVDLSLLSGESMPVEVAVQDQVWGGTTNLQDTLVIKVSQAVRDSRVAAIAEMVSQAAEARAPVVQLADRVAGWFVAAVLLLAAATFIIWSSLDPTVALDHTVALLIVSCPCALGLATPLVMSAAMGKAARRGILARSGAALEALGSLKGGTLFFDKTGTLTHGRMQVCAFAGPEWVQAYVAAAERASTHPVGRALCQAFEVQDKLQVADFESVCGGGVRAEVAGKNVLIGSAKFVLDHALADTALVAEVDAWSLDGLTPVWIAIDGRVLGAVGLADRLRCEAKESVQALTARGFEVHILSGDHPAVVASVGRALDLPPERCHGAQTPEAKLAKIEAYVSAGPVLMVGDGVNDAAALAAATVGVAVHGGAETCLEAADVFLQRPGVRPLVALVVGARRTVATLRVNIIFSLVYNMAGVALAMTGHLNPLVAAVLMPLSSLVVVSNSYRFRFGD